MILQEGTYSQKSPVPARGTPGQVWSPVGSPNRRKIVVPSMVCFLSRLPDRSISTDHTWKSRGNHMAFDHMLKSRRANNPNNKCYSANMDRTQESDALRRYPLYRTPISRHFSSTFNQTLTSPTLISPQYHSPWPPRQCNLMKVLSRASTTKPALA